MEYESFLNDKFLFYLIYTLQWAVVGLTENTFASFSDTPKNILKYYVGREIWFRKNLIEVIKELFQVPGIIRRGTFSLSLLPYILYSILYSLINTMPM